MTNLPGDKDLDKGCGLYRLEAQCQFLALNNHLLKALHWAQKLPAYYLQVQFSNKKIRFKGAVIFTPQSFFMFTVDFNHSVSFIIIAEFASF